jgi:pimeloyl-ACP methyl ester carboxylesterase
VVAAVGEPGVGKSRLFDEFLRSDTFGAWRLRRCGCLPYGANTPWLPTVNLVKGYFGIQDRDDQERATKKIFEGLAPFGAAMAWAAMPVRALLDLTIDDAAWQALNPPQRRRRILDAVKGLLLLETDRQPLVLIVEDLHWADEETVVLLDSLVESLPSQRMLILATYRPEFEHRWGGRACYCQLRIDPLGTEDAGRLLRALLGSDPSVADLERSLVDRTGGNPLFLEEAVRDLAETGVLDGQPGAYRLTGELGSLRLPQTVQAILAARIDRLSEEARQLLQRAAVIGHEVPRVLLEAVVDLQGEALDRRLGELQAAEMLHETRPMPEVEYTFKHALTHDVAYGTMLRESRRTLHRRVGEAMEALYSERLIELAETLADHFERGEVWAKAARYALDAAEKAKSRYAYKVGMRIADQARAAAKDPALIQEWIWANVQRGDLASLLDDLELANESYAQALSKSKDLSERRWIENKHHALRFAIRDGAKIAYYVHGSGHQTLVFVIPIAYGLAVFQPIIERLCQEFRIITINPRGTIGSDPLPQAYTLVEHALDVATVVGTAAEHPVTAIGISLGTTILTHAVCAAPQLFEKLVMVGAVAGMPVPNSARARCAAAEMQAIAKADFEGALRGLSASIISEPGTDDLQQLWSETRLRLPKETILNFYQQVTPDQMAAVPLLQKLRKPTLVMHGTADIRIPVEEGRQIAERVEGAQFYPLEGRCHLCMFTATDEFCDVLRDFVRTGRVSVPVVHAVGVLDK